ncbi:MAG: hypothetical protein AAFQ82_14045, partial [Myxococcota bacterium]
FHLKQHFEPQTEFAVVPLQADALTFESVANGKLIELGTHGEGAPIQFRSQAGAAQLTPYFAHVGGEWLIARVR